MPLRARSLRGLVQVLRLPMAKGFARNKDGTVTWTEYVRLAGNQRRYAVGPSIQGLVSEIAQVILDCDREGKWTNLDLSGAHAGALATIVGVINQASTYKAADRPDLKIPIDAADAVRKLAKNGWDSVVDSAGLPRNVVKPSICAAWMGASFVASRKSSIMDSLLSHHTGDWRESRRSLRRLEAVSKAYVDAARHLGNSLHRMIDRPLYDSRVRRLLEFQTRSDGIYLRNAAGGFLHVRALDGAPPADLNSGRRLTKPQLKAKMISHLLTGCERQFMKSLISELEYLKIPFIDMHDGLLAYGKVPQSAIKSATKDSVMAGYVKMKAKPLCDHEDNRYSELLKAIGMSWEEVFGEGE